MKTSAEIAALIQEISSSSPDMKEITVDGIKYVRDLTALDRWERRAAREASPATRPVSATINVSDA